MPKVSIVCLNCNEVFERYPAFIRHAENRGSTIKFCSRACTDSARSKGIIATKTIRGANLNCEVCNKEFYRTQSSIKSNRCRFCSSDCQKKAFKLNLIDRSKPRPKRKRGSAITCIICSKEVYRKQSMIDRNIDKTCGNRKCISDYGRNKWGLEPREEPKVRKNRRRGHNFTAKQRRELIGDSCAWCSTIKNLTLDHVIPVCCGGLPVPENAQTLCGECNNLKAKHFDRPMARQQSKLGGFQS